MSFRDGDPASDKETRLHFIPYADRENPKFDYQGYCDEFSEFAWEWDVNDSPDVEAIQGETVRRLHFGHKIDLETINATGVLTALRISNEDGLLWYYAQSDPIPWFKNPNHDYPKLPTTTYKLSDYKERFFNNASLFCGNLNCVMSICPTHPSPTPLREPPKPTKTAAGIRFMVTEACGKDCISVVTDKDRSVPPRDWTESDIQDLKTILMLEPDALPCDLAVLCRKLCWEVGLRQRCLLLPDSKISPVTRTHERPSKRIQFRTPGPCHHEGACSAKDVDCPCFSAGYHCTTRCYCDTGCRTGLLKWKGCACKGPCHRAQCICWKSGRECDLDVCGCTRCVSYFRYFMSLVLSDT
ncbi:hypothetical protein OF83DRAFT_1073136 [Amylostereum chailletii]|nr:hypothetical protein OF83DRAFT_1073136 [Amylostereum chailletii]